VNRLEEIFMQLVEGRAGAGAGEGVRNGGALPATTRGHAHAETP
jgi:hypothetical protein